MVVVVDRTNRLYAYSKQVVDLEGETVTLPVVFRPMACDVDLRRGRLALRRCVARA